MSNTKKWLISTMLALSIVGCTKDDSIKNLHDDMSSENINIQEIVKPKVLVSNSIQVLNYVENKSLGFSAIAPNEYERCKEYISTHRDSISDDLIKSICLSNIQFKTQLFTDSVFDKYRRWLKYKTLQRIAYRDSEPIDSIITDYRSNLSLLLRHCDCIVPKAITRYSYCPEVTIIIDGWGRQTYTHYEKELSIYEHGHRAGIPLLGSSNSGEDFTTLAMVLSGTVREEAKSKLCASDKAKGLILIDISYPESDCLIRGNYILTYIPIMTLPEVIVEAQQPEPTPDPIWNPFVSDPIPRIPDFPRSGIPESHSTAKGIFKNTDLSDEQWSELSESLEEMLEDCLGKSLYSRVLEKARAHNLRIEFWNERDSRHRIDSNGNVTITLTNTMLSDHLIHELMHFYQYTHCNGSILDFSNNRLMYEIEAWVTQYIYTTYKLKQKKKWTERYNLTTSGKSVKKLGRMMNDHGEFLPGYTTQQINSQIRRVKWGLQNLDKYKSMKVDPSIPTTSYFNNLYNLTTNCL